MAVSVRTTDVDEVREVASRVLHPHRLSVVGDATRFGMTLTAASIGPLTVGWLQHDTPVRIESSHPGYYQVNIPTAGPLTASVGGEEVLADAGVAVVHNPDRPAVFTGWTVPAPVLAVRIAKQALDHELAQLLDRPLRRSPDLAPRMDVATGRGAQWLALVRSLATDLTDAGALLRQPMVAAPFAHCVLSGLLMAASHSYRSELAAPVAAVAAPTVRTARAYIEAHAGEAVTVADIARAAGVGVRGLQQGFQRSLGMTPLQYLRRVRLREAHRALREADAGSTTVGEVAARWGFGHQGRFTAEYRRCYGLSPTETLRRSR